MTYSLGSHIETLVHELIFSQTLPVKSCHTNSKFGGAFFPPVSGVDLTDQAQKKA